jgi:hypothetical protein
VSASGADRNPQTCSFVPLGHSCEGPTDFGQPRSVCALRMSAPIVCRFLGISGNCLHLALLIPPCGGTRSAVPDTSPVEIVFAGTSRGIYGSFLRLARLIPACVRRLSATLRTAQTGRRRCGRLPVQLQQIEKTPKWVQQKELLRQRWRVHTCALIILLLPRS